MTMKAATYNSWIIHAGADFRKTLRYTDKSLPKIANPNFDSSCPPTKSNPMQIAAPKDLTGYSALMDIRADDDPTSALLVALTTGAGDITIGSPTPTDGTIEIFINNAVTGNATFVNYINQDVYYCLVLVPPAGGDVQPVLHGTIKVLQCSTDLSGLP